MVQFSLFKVESKNYSCISSIRHLVRSTKCTLSVSFYKNLYLNCGRSEPAIRRPVNALSLLRKSILIRKSNFTILKSDFFARSQRIFRLVHFHLRRISCNGCMVKLYFYSPSGYCAHTVKDR